MPAHLLPHIVPTALMLYVALALSACSITIDIQGSSPEEEEFGYKGLAQLEAIELRAQWESLYRAGKLAEALPVAVRRVELAKKSLPSDHPQVAFALTDLAMVYDSLGDYEKAAPLHQRALGILEKAKGSDHPDVVGAIEFLAASYLQLKDDVKAEALLRRALAILEATDNADSLFVASAINNLAMLYDRREEYAKAEPLYRRALDLMVEARGPDHLDVVVPLTNLAIVNDNLGEYERAEALHQRALAIRERAQGHDHPDLSVSFFSLAAHDAAQKKYSTALQYLAKGLAIQEKQIRSAFSVATNQQKLQFARLISGGYSGTLSLIHQRFGTDRDAVRYGLELVLRRKGIVFDAQSQAGQGLLNRLPSGTQSGWKRLEGLKQSLAHLSLNRPPSMSDNVYTEALKDLQFQIEETERVLFQNSAFLAMMFPKAPPDVEGTLEHMVKDSALLEFVRIQDVDFAHGMRDSSRKGWRYLAFVLAASGDVTLVDLGDAATIDAAAQRMLRRLRRFVPRDPITSEEAHQSLKEFYVKVWAPLEKAIGSADKVLISPDGLLNLVPFAALMDGEGHSLVERYRIAYVASGRELVGSVKNKIQPVSDLLLVADPAYDLEVQKTATTDAPSPPLRSREFQGGFKLLPGTQIEARGIPPLVAGQEERKRTLTDVHATEAAVKATRSPRVLHLATHGFFLQDKELSLEESKRGTAGRYENPLIRSGLALAGANRAAEITEGEDGLLTALEVTGLDLHGTELVVLSACETGVGDVQNGEGVFGLRRAFALAGAKNLLMSLWKVDDAVTAEQMKAFYENFPKMPPAEALRQAQLETIKKLKDGDGIASPTLWAPFILQGAHALGP